MEPLTIFLSFLLTTFASIYFYLRRRHGKIEHLGIPIVPPFLCFGSPPFIHHRYLTHEYYERMHQKFGKTWGRYSGLNPTIMTIDPEVIKEVMVKQFDNFIDFFDWEVPDGRLTLDRSRGEVWRSLRKTLSPIFTSGKLKSMLEPMEQVSDQLVKHLGTFAQENVAASVKPIFEKFSLETIGRCAFGIEGGGHDSEENENEILKFGKRIFGDMACTDLKSDFLFQLIFLFPAVLKLFDLFGNAADKLVEITEAIMKEREEKKIVRGDFLDRLREISKEPKDPINRKMITAQGITFFSAGFDTISTALSTITYNLAMNPEIQEKLFEEIQSVLEKHSGRINHETIAGMHLLEAAIQENLRMFSPANQSGRLCTRDCIVNGMSIKKNTFINMPMWASHRNPEFFPDPEVFRPERFLKENSDEIIPYTFRPFGAGPRNCIGKRFAMVEMTIAIAKILNNFKIEKTEETKMELKKGCFFLIGFEEIKVKFVARKKC